MIEPCSRFPNTSVRNLPLLIVRQCFQPSQVSAKDVEQTFRANKWQPSWQYAMFPFRYVSGKSGTSAYHQSRETVYICLQILGSASSSRLALDQHSHGSDSDWLMQPLPLKHP